MILELDEDVEVSSPDHRLHGCVGDHSSTAKVGEVHEESSDELER